MTKPDFTPPPRAQHHCRHYSYVIGKGWPRGEGDGMCCAAGVSMDDGAGSDPCISNPIGWCPRREDWTEAERAKWAKWSKDCRNRLTVAIQALPRQIPINTSSQIPCPSCGANIRYGRWRGGAMIECETPNCCAARVSVDEGLGWPV